MRWGGIEMFHKDFEIILTVNNPKQREAKIRIEVSSPIMQITWYNTEGLLQSHNKRRTRIKKRETKKSQDEVRFSFNTIP